MEQAEDDISNGVVPYYSTPHHSNSSLPLVNKKKRNLPGNPDPEAEVIALSPNTLMATNRFPCDICGKGFQRDQNLQLHRRGHNLPWKLKQRANKDAVVRKRVYVCPESSCVHHHPSRALGDLTGIKKHFCRKHGEKKYKCEKCSKKYAVQSDWKAHMKTCGTREYRCDCGTVFSRRDSFITHRAFCEALAEESARLNNGVSLFAPNAQHLNGTSFVFGQNSAPYNHSFPSLPIFSNSNDSFSEQARSASLSLWMGQGQQTQDSISVGASSQEQIHQIHLMNSISSSLLNTDHSSLVACSNPQSLENSYNIQQMNWGFENKLCSSNNEDAFVFSSNMDNVPSLYSKQHQIKTGGVAESGLSATALLQKASQMGASSATDPSIFASFGLKASNGIGGIQEGQNKYYGDMFGSNSMVTSLGSDHDTDNSNNESSTTNQLALRVQPPAKRRRLEDEEGQTRDFLGVGVEPTSHPWI